MLLDHSISVRELAKDNENALSVCIANLSAYIITR